MLSVLVAGLCLGAVAAIPDPKELEASLWTDLLDRWFPTCVDPKGGFRQNFGPDFKPHDDGARGLVFQSRMTWVCASVADGRPAFAKYARHGVRFLKDRMNGGLTWSLDKNGKPAKERHAYGISFAIYGLAAAGRHLKDAEALRLAQRAFRYLEEHHYDRKHGGYFEATDLRGRAKLSGKGRDSIGTLYGQKSQNTHLHLLEAFTELYRAWPNPLVKKRLTETLGLFNKELFAAPGHLTLFVRRDWTPASTDTSYGHDVEAAHLMLDAADALGRRDDPLVMKRARQLVDNSLAHGWDEKSGGLYNMGNAAGATDKRKIWWVEAEALLGFATLWTRTQDPRYGEALADEWAFIKAHGIDHERGGWYEETAEDGTPKRNLPKGHAWKAAYHDGRALLFTARLLRKVERR
ncbi:hypothetical protein EON82_15035 [bacterium]|nr:MAG: hypothetical protein EON82_15035 [bacterium]